MSKIGVTDQSVNSHPATPLPTRWISWWQLHERKVDTKVRTKSIVLIEWSIADPKREANAMLDIDYRASLPKLRRAVEMLNDAYDAGNIAFSIHLGDLIDRDSTSFGPVLTEWRTLNHDAFLVPGNHELGAFGQYDRAVQALGIKSEAVRRLRIPGPRDRRSQPAGPSP